MIQCVFVQFSKEDDKMVKDTILVIDVDVDGIQEIMNILSDSYRICTADSFEDALLIIRDIIPELILIDSTMSAKDGFDILEFLKTNDKSSHIPVIFITPLDNPDFEVRAFDMGSVDYITKPFVPKVVRKRIETQIKLAQEELESHKAQAGKLADRMELVWNDYTFALVYNAASGKVDASEAEAIRLKIADSEAAIIEAEKKRSVLNEVKEQLSRNLAQTRDDIEEKETACSLLSRIMEMNTSIDKKYERLKGLKADVDSARNRIYECEEAAASANSEYDTARDFEDSTRKAYDEIIKSWEEQYAPYYDENVSIEIDDDTYRLDKDEIESRFTGLKTALSQKNSDFADKQALMNHLSASMNKCRDAIEYRGYTCLLYTSPSPRD